GKYGFKLLHDTERPHFFVHEDLEILRVTITTSDHIPTVSLHEARKMANRMHQPRPTPSPPNILIDNSTSLPSISTFSNLPPRSAPSPPNVLIDNSLSSNIFPSTSTFSNLPPRSAPSPPNVLMDNSLSSNKFPSTFSNLPPRPAPSPPNGLIDNSLSSNIFPSTFSNLPPRPAPSPPISEYKLITTIPLSSLPKPKAPPTVIKSPPSSPTFASRTKYSKSQIPNSPTKIPKFPSMTLSILNASRTPPYIPKNNKYNELSMGYV
ncbi:13012_t:CDS:2, partial [Rhizophagus irregularis]